MTSELLQALPVVGLVVVVTGVLSYFRGEYLADARSRGGLPRGEVRVRVAIGFAVLALLVGILAAIFFVLLRDVFPMSAVKIFRNIGLGVAVFISLVAAAARWRTGLTGLWESIALALLWGVAYGILLPRLLA
jgi:hypothetical protein